MEEEESFEEEEVAQPKVERIDETNPYWIEDDRLKHGQVDFLSGGEIVFWKEMIKKYLLPLEMSEKQKREQKTGLEDYRDVIIFTFLMVNCLYVVGVTVLQAQTSIFLEWTVFSFADVGGQDGILHNITYIAPTTKAISALIQVGNYYKPCISQPTRMSCQTIHNALIG